MQQFSDVYGDTMRQKHRDCQNCCVLIQRGDVSQCGFILSCGDRFCYVLTTESNMLHNANTDFAITFGDELERRFSASNVIVHSGNKLSVLFLCDGIETIKAKQAVDFSNQENLEGCVIYTLSYFPKEFYHHRGRPIQCHGATSYFRGGSIGTVNLQHEGIAIFNHNCCHGTDVINGSIVLNERCEIIGINIEYLTGWITALYFSTIRNELAEIFSDAENKTFAAIQEYLNGRGEVEANKTNI